MGVAERTGGVRGDGDGAGDIFVCWRRCGAAADVYRILPGACYRRRRLLPVLYQPAAYLLPACATRSVSGVSILFLLAHLALCCFCYWRGWGCTGFSCCGRHGQAGILSIQCGLSILVALVLAATACLETWCGMRAAQSMAALLDICGRKEPCVWHASMFSHGCAHNDVANVPLTQHARLFFCTCTFLFSCVRAFARLPRGAASHHRATLSGRTSGRGATSLFMVCIRVRRFSQGWFVVTGDGGDSSLFARGAAARWWRALLVRAAGRRWRIAKVWVACGVASHPFHLCVWRTDFRIINISWTAGTYHSSVRYADASICSAQHLVPVFLFFSLLTAGAFRTALPRRRQTWDRSLLPLTAGHAQNETWRDAAQRWAGIAYRARRRRHQRLARCCRCNVACAARVWAILSARSHLVCLGWFSTDG